MIYKMDMQWKEFNVDLEAVNTTLKGLYPHFAGPQGHSILEFWFNEEPSQEDKDAIQAYWDGLASDSAEALSYRSKDAVKAAIQSLREGIVSKEWAAMSAVERKMFMNLDVSKAELIAAELL